MTKRSAILRFALFLALLFAFLCSACASPPGDGEGAPDTGSGEPDSAESTSGVDAVAGGAAEKERRPLGLGGRPFWHDAELVTALGLDEAQLSIMETRRQAALDEQRAKRQAATELRAELSKRMAEGAFEDARRLATRLAADAAAAVEADVELKIGILDLLTPEERRRLLEERPSALRRSWLLPGASKARGSGQNPLLDGTSGEDQPGEQPAAE